MAVKDVASGDGERTMAFMHEYARLKRHGKGLWKNTDQRTIAKTRDQLDALVQVISDPEREREWRKLFRSGVTMATEGSEHDTKAPILPTFRASWERFDDKTYDVLKEFQYEVHSNQYEELCDTLEYS
jgi:hypothetical protein